MCATLMCWAPAACTETRRGEKQKSTDSFLTRPDLNIRKKLFCSLFQKVKLSHILDSLHVKYLYKNVEILIQFFFFFGWLELWVKNPVSQNIRIFLLDHCLPHYCGFKEQEIPIIYTVWMVIYWISNVNVLIFWYTDFWLSLAVSSNHEKWKNENTLQMFYLVYM